MNKVDIMIIENIAKEAGDIIMSIYETDFNVSYKSDASPLTLADQKANDLIVTKLKAHYPNYAILSEESKDDLTRLTEDYCFIVDPLDGTKEFVTRNGEFTVNIALVYKGDPILGVIYVPVTKKLYSASSGKGAYLIDDLGDRRALKVSSKVTDLMWVGSKSHASEKEQQLIEAYKGIIGDRMSVGSSLKGCMIAEGVADVYYRFGLTSEWDTAAMQCIVEEAGGIFRQMDGSNMTYNRKNNLNEKGFFIVNRSENIWV